MEQIASQLNIIYAANDGYVQHLAVSLLSMLEHNKRAESITIYILSVGISTAYRQHLAEITARFDRTLVILELDDIKDRFSFPIDTRGFDISAMSRLFSASMLPLLVERALYLDCDTVVLGDLIPLWNTDLGDAVIGMVMEPTVYEDMKAAIDLQPEDPYYNSGVLLMDLVAFRREQIEAQLLHFYATKQGNLFACDQDTLNGALKGRIKTLSPRYNFFTNYFYFRYSSLVKASQTYTEISPSDFSISKKHPVILHYMGDERPWVAGNFNPAKKYYEHYLSLTPWRNVPLQAGKKGYMFLYHCMNLLTLVCPPIRRMISRRFGMQIIDARKNPGE